MLFKILHGDDSNISLDITPFHEGYCYVTHSGDFWVDMNIGTEGAPNNQRIKLNARDAETVTGASLSTILNDSEVEIPTSKAILDALNLKQDVITGTEGQYVGFDSDGNTAAFDLPSEVIISDTEPTDETAEIWINTSEEWNDNIAGGASSWNDLTDKPFNENNIINKESLPEGYPYKEQGEEVVIEWDGNTDGLANFGVFYKVSDAVFENLSGANVIVGDLYGELHFDVTLGEKTNQQGIDGYYPSDASATNGMPAVAVVHEGSDPGTYFFKEGDHLYVSKLNVVLKTIHPMAPEFLPRTTVSATLNEDDMSASVNMTYADIKALVDKGSIVEVALPFMGNNVLRYCGTDFNGGLSFCTPWVLNPYNSDGIDVFFVSVFDDESVDFKYFKASGTWGF